MTVCVYTIASGKGGTGKTTTTVNLGTSLAMLGKKTTILDADIGMANMGLLLGLEKSAVTLHEVLSGTADVKDAIYDGPGGVKVVPSGLSLKGFQHSNPDKIKEIMSKLIDGMDYVLIDAPAGISKDGVIPLAVADKVILVVNPELSSMADALKTKALTEMLGRPVEGAILNRSALEKTEINRNKVAELLGIKILEMIPEDANIRTSAAFKTPVVIRAPNAPSSLAFKKLAAQLAGMEFKENGNQKANKEGFVDRLARSIFGGN
ncbi:MAG: cell division ATPase MinD [Candidatus Methanoperedens sp.]|nr:cell division ATPase MinD [Candidatus Methanoperedens sp.]